MLSSIGELLGKNIWEEFPIAARNEEINHNVHQAMNDGIASDFEAFYPDPLNLWLSIQCRPFEDGIVLFFRDITAERVSRQILLQQQATLAFVQETARVATWEMDLINRTVKYGEGSYPVYGRPFSEITTIDDLDKIIRPSDLVHVQQDAKQAIDTNTVSIVDYEVSTPEGGSLWVECRRVPVYNSAGVATHLRGMTSDITSRHQADSILRQQQELLASVQQAALARPGRSNTRPARSPMELVPIRSSVIRSPIFPTTAPSKRSSCPNTFPSSPPPFKAESQVAS